MAADVVVEIEKEKSCCAVLKANYSKLEEKRNALRQAVKLLEREITKLQTANANLRKENEEGRARLETEVAAKLEESAARVGLGNELSELKSEISLLRKTAGSRIEQDDQVNLLQNQVLEGEAEMNRLRELLEKEKKQVQTERKKVVEERKKTKEVAVLQTRVAEGESELSRLKDLLGKEEKSVESERKRAEKEKKKAAEAWNLVKAEKKKFEEQKKIADTERNKAEEYRLQLEAARNEADETRLNLLAEEEETNLRIEAEKQKLKRTKKHADSEMAKAEKHRKSAEAERKKAIDEKNRADVLAQKLEVEMERNGALQREIQEIISGKNVEHLPTVSLNNNGDAKMANMKLLEKELKLKKMQVKLAKRVASVEKLRNNMLQQEICCLKQEFFQMSHRLNMLDGFLCHSNEGIDGTAKIDNLFDLQNINLKRKMSVIRPCDLYHQSENDPLGPMLECDGLWCLNSEGGCTKPISGISSESEFMVGCSVRNTSQNSAVHSTTASFSDRQLDSQGRGGFPVTTSAKLAEENLEQRVNTHRLYRDIIQIRDKENLGEVAENNGLSLDHEKVESPSLNCESDINTKVVTEVPSSRKKRRIQGAVDSTEYFYANDKKLSLQMKEKPPSLHGMLNHKNDVPAPICSQTVGKSLALENGRPLVAKSVDNLYAKDRNSGKRRSVSQEQQLYPQLCVEDVNQKKTDKRGNEGGVDAVVCTQAASPVGCLTCPCGDNTVDAVMRNCGDETWFENMAIRDCMKLLELDDAVDEERYMEAMERPLSPTLPEIDSHILGASELTDSQFLINRNFVGLGNGKNGLVPFCTSNVANVEDDSNWHRVNSPVKSFKELVDDGNSFHAAVCAAKTGGRQIGESVVDMEVAKQIPVPETEGTEIPSASNVGHINERVSKCYVVFSSTKDESSISRIFHSTETCAARLSMVSQKDWMVQKILLAVVMEDLLPEEKACVFFTLLLFNFSVVDSVKAGSSSTGDSFSCSESFLAHIKTVMDDVESRRTFSELFELDALLGIIEDFLIDGRVLVSGDVPCGSGCRIFVLNGMTTYLSPQLATIHQLMVGSIILASICRAVDYVSFICDASYNILRMCKFGSSLILRVLHVFAYLCGEKYFTLSKYDLIMTVIKSIVSHLEGGKESFGKMTVSNAPCKSNNCPWFSRCLKCPFSDGAVSMDEVLLLLLQRIQNYADFGIKQHNMIGSSSSSSHTIFPCLETAVESFSQPDEDIRDMDCNGSSRLSKLLIDATSQSSSVVNGSLCSFSDILALVELVACSMNWEWTRRSIIPGLLEMLESGIPEKLLAAIIVLLGQLGRLGLDSSGYQKMGIEDLKCSLSDFLNQSATRNWGFPTQLAIVNSLIGLLSQDFAVLVQNEQLLSPVAHQSSHSDIIRKWFTQLSKEQKSLSFSLFQSAGVLD
ncbi:uncharacterized protein LOC122085648 [Macadamia integrifolia]|uniref:uncharacterized protein LOC122085648 n=1 Tax=Macadamia integrifolia TaxID=60698 RepID=UPI001C4E7F9B|nr:uncharacterized protein LOC122085648 [Macadamia integrifolia]